MVRLCPQVGMSISELPEGFNPHKGIKRVFEGRRKMMESGEGIDWGFAEALAFGTLVSEGGVPAMPSPLALPLSSGLQNQVSKAGHLSHQLKASSTGCCRSL